MLGYKHGCWIYKKLRKVQALYAQMLFSRASSDTYLKWLLGPDQDLVFTFSNPALKSALGWGRSPPQKKSSNGPELRLTTLQRCFCSRTTTVYGHTNQTQKITTGHLFFG